MLNRSLKSLIVLFLLLPNLKLMAGYPLGDVTTLPPPAVDIEPKDLEIISSILKLAVYADSKDPDLYYYVPPFRVLPYDQGAATIVPHTIKADNVFQADSIMKQMQTEAVTPPESVTNSAAINSRRADVERAERRLERNEDRFFDETAEMKSKISGLESELKIASTNNQTQLIALLTEMLSKAKEEFIKFKEDGERKLALENAKVQAIKNSFNSYAEESVTKWRNEYLRTRLYVITTYLASAGKSIDMKLYPEAEDLVIAINDTIEELKKSYGGFLSMNIYSGFTEKQLEEIRLLRAKYWPKVKISLMLANDLKFAPLSQLEKTTEGIRDNTMFKEVRGAGGYHGATVNFDLTVDGAASFSLALGPFVLPIGVSAVVRENVPAFKGTVTCNYTNGFNIKGRTDVIDGWVIFDNDVRNDLKSQSNNKGSCSVTVIEGDTESANYYALKDIERNYQENFISRTKLSQTEARAYYESALSELEDRKYEAEKEKNKPIWTEKMYKMDNRELVIRTLSSAASTYWHTTKLDSGIVDNLNYTKTITHPAQEALRKDMYPTLCLFYNAEKQAYDRCTNDQEEKARNSVAATVQAYTAPECKGTKSIEECKKARREKASELKPQQEKEVVDNLLDI